MASLKKFLKSNISKVDTGYEYSVTNKQFWYDFYLDFFISLFTNYFEWKNIPDSWDKLFLEKALCANGYIGVYEDYNFGLIVSKGAKGGRLDIYDNPTVFRPINNSQLLTRTSVPINWYADNLNPDGCVIIGNDNYYRPSYDYVRGFCMKLADIEQTIQLNRNAQIRPFVVIADQNSHFSLKNIFNKIMNGDPVVYVNKQKDAAGNIAALQLEDYIHVLDTKTDFLLDKLHDEKQRVINQMLTFIGINNNAVDKAERLVSAEATSNNGLINACIERWLEARREGVKRVNACWGLNIKVQPASQIEMFNTERVLSDIDRGVGEITDAELDE